MAEKRKRSRNFDSKEEELIISLFEKYRDILASKLNNAISNEKKKKIYLKIKQVNALGVWPRSVEQIKNKWSNMVCDGKRKEAQIKKSHRQTGRGKPVPQMTASQEKIISLYRETPSFSGLDAANESLIFSGIAIIYRCLRPSLVNNTS